MVTFVYIVSLLSIAGLIFISVRIFSISKEIRAKATIQEVNNEVFNESSGDLLNEIRKLSEEIELLKNQMHSKTDYAILTKEKRSSLYPKSPIIVGKSDYISPLKHSSPYIIYCNFHEYQLKKISKSEIIKTSARRHSARKK